jgi:serine/threonine protein kinase
VFPDEVASPVRVGDIVAGKYRIERELGRGGVGVVMAAHHLALDEPVALKFVLDRGGVNGEAVERLLREARATFRLRSPHAVRVHDVGRIPDGPVYIVMELLEGRDLRAELAARGPLPEREVVAYALDVCNALEEAHAAGIVHRDLKPHNLFLTRSLYGKPMVKVLDFGLSKLDAELFEAGPLTRPQTALGTPRYMAPEQWKSAAEVDARADVWGLGMVMYELLTGKAPLQGMAWEERRARFLAGAVPSPRDLRPELSEPVARVIVRCLRSDPAVRWSSAAQLAEALLQAVPSAPPPAMAPGRHTAPTAVMPPEIRALQVARAFDDLEPQTLRDFAPPKHSTPAGREGPKALGSGVPNIDLYSTEVRAPLFSPEDLAGLAPQRLGDERIIAGTLASQGMPQGLAQVTGGPSDPLGQARAWAPLTPPPAPQPGSPPRASSPRMSPEGSGFLSAIPFAPKATKKGDSATLVVLAVLGLLATTAGFVWVYLDYLGR